MEDTDPAPETWDPHGILEEFCVVIGMTVPSGEEAYLTALEQFNWIKQTLAISEAQYPSSFLVSFLVFPLAFLLSFRFAVTHTVWRHPQAS